MKKKTFSLVLVLCLLTGSTTAVPVNNKEGMIMEFQARAIVRFSNPGVADALSF